MVFPSSCRVKFLWAAKILSREVGSRSRRLTSRSFGSTFEHAWHPRHCRRERRHVIGDPPGIKITCAEESAVPVVPFHESWSWVTISMKSKENQSSQQTLFLIKASGLKILPSLSYMLYFSSRKSTTNAVGIHGIGQRDGISVRYST